ncbi:HutD family protein [Rhodococcus sp. SGAir0479]|uniref:HutD family protein n=1 Tax=Rhodococcus sp. SGAir0479 TaxID=2567884 RepID=UPI0020C7B14B|nr:HutD family protein [Rhodococcus sp. SGAir0479]
MDDGPYSFGAAVRRTSRDDRVTVRWRNGQGTTQVIAETEWWRVSIADEPTSSTFSVIEGYDRLIMPLGTVSMELSGTPSGAEFAPDGVARHVVAPLQTFAFPGEWAPRGRVDTPTRALNVMVRRDAATATMRLGTRPGEADPAALLVLVDPVTEEAIVVPPGSTDAFTAGDPCAVVTVTTFGRS